MGSRLSLLLLLGDQASSSVTTAIHVETFAVTQSLFAAIIYIGKNHSSDSIAAVARLAILNLKFVEQDDHFYTIQTAF